MTETRFTWQWLFVVAGIGLAIGLVIGLLAGWIVIPAATTGVDVSALNAGDQNDYIVLVANSYAYDNDLPRARQRLALLKDANISSRLDRLAKALDTRQDPSASNVASLAIALGSKDSSLDVMAATVASIPGGSPTKFAQVELEPSATAEPTQQAPTDVPEATATIEPTTRPTKVSQVVATKSSPKPAPTNPPTAVPQQAAALQPQWTPGKDQWWQTIQYIPASVQPGQQYFRLKSALYCEPEDSNPDPACANKAGGGNDYTIYISLVDQSGNRVEDELIVQLPDGTVTDEGQAAKVKSASDMCNCNYSTQINNYTIKVKGLPSDAVSGFCACSVHRGWPSHAHVRYFLVFQLTTR